MPKIVTDYSNTIIYKITCKDQEIKDVYVGHTTDFVRRKNAHKQCSNNPKSSNCKLYNTIREKGGWDSWNMEIINFFKCKNHYEARQKEQEYFVSLNANLNSIEPLPKPKENIVIDKHVKSEKNIHKKHLECNTTTQEHIITLSDKFNCKKIRFKCEKCDYSSCNKSDYTKHISTQKHICQFKSMTYDVNVCEKSQKSQDVFSCEKCNKQYKDYSGLWRHKKTCALQKHADASIVEQLLQQNHDFKNIIMEQNKMFVGQSIDLQKQTNELNKQNQELQKQILDICKNGIITNNTNNVNSNNKTFNLQVFLNEECKDAMNIKDFIDSIQFQLADVESVGELGYINGISKIIIQNLNALDTYKRPVHCTDEKRETIYIKDAGVWSKDDDNNKLRKMIQIHFWEKWSKNNDIDSDFAQLFPKVDYNKIVLEATGGGSKCNDTESENKIMRKIAKVIGIDKHNLS